MNQDIKLSDEQTSAFNAILAFIHEPSQPVFVLKGYAGTGKTMILGVLAQWLKNNEQPFQLLAPTGRAARILSTKTGYAGSTIHRQIYSLIDEKITDKDRLEVTFKIAPNNGALNTLYIVDEASMVSDVQNKSEILRFGSGKLLSDLFHYVDFENSSRKVLFVGDDAQLEPVGMSYSPALSQTKLFERLGVHVPIYTLKTVFRQASLNTILKTATELRNEIEKDHAKVVAIAADGGNINEQSKDELVQHYAKHIREATELKMNWICYTNDAVHEINTHVRSWLGFIQADIVVGEYLMVIQNNYQNDVFFLNGDLVKVLEVSNRTEKHEVIFNYKDQKNIRRTLYFKDVTIEHCDYPGKAYSVKVLENTLKESDLEILNVAIYVLTQNRYQASNKLIKFQQFRLEDPYAIALRVHYGYAMTVHKAQGGEWDTVIADLKHPTGKHKRPFQRWAYTAITRAKNMLYVLNPIRSGAFSRLIVNQTKQITRIRYSEPDEIPEIYADDPDTFQDYPFLKPVMERFKGEAERFGIELDVDYSKPYRVRLTFKKGTMSLVKDLIYGKKGINPILADVGKPALDLQSIVDLICQKATTSSEGIDAYRPAEAFRADFFDLICGLTQALDIKMTGFLSNPFNDVYLLHTDQTGSELICHYNQEKQFTTVEPCSLTGKQDHKLNLLTQRLSLNKLH